MKQYKTSRELLRKLTYPLKHVGWKSIFPFEMVSFQDASFFLG